jgi:hypothetical protein
MPQAASFAQSGLNIAGDVANYGTNTNAINTATNVQNQAYGAGIAGLTSQGQQNQAAWDPYQKLGTTALQSLQNPDSITQGITSDPSYQFAVKQGSDVMNQQAASRGHFFSPQTMQALTAYGQNIGSEWYQTAFNNLMGQAKMGQQATGSATSQATGIQEMINNLLLGRGEMQGSSAMAGAAAQDKLWGGITGTLGQMSPSPSGGSKGKGGAGGGAMQGPF